MTHGLLIPTVKRMQAGIQESYVVTETALIIGDDLLAELRR